MWRRNSLDHHFIIFNMHKLYGKKKDSETVGLGWGLLVLLTCLRLEPEAEKKKCIFIRDRNVPKYVNVIFLAPYIHLDTVGFQICVPLILK